MKSILSKLWLGITCLVLIILLIIWLFQIGLLNKFYIQQRTDILLEEGNKLTSLFLQSNDYNSVSQEIIDEINSFSSSYNVRIVIIDSKSNVLFVNAPQQEVPNKTRDSYEEIFEKSLSLFYNDPDVQSNISEGKTFVTEYKSNNFHRATIFVGVPIWKDEELIGNVLLTSPLASIEETISILRGQLSIISIVSLVVGTLLALLFAKTFTKPILMIIGTTKKIAKGDFEAKVSLDSGDEIGVLGDTINDMAIQLGQIEKFRKEFIANTSHELKTPISLIAAYAELVKDIDFNEEEKNQYLQIIIDEAHRLNEMVEDILYLSKMEAGYSKINLEKISVKEIVNRVIEKLNFFATNKNIKLIVEIDGNPFIYADKDKLYQVFFNIINNAINHSFENSKVVIKATNITDILKIEIIDNGKGIPKEDLPYVWDRFYKVDKSRKRDDSGTGLGMAIVKNILEIHGFRYGIESEVNRGTTAWFEIKIADS